ncbi:MAG: homoserine dehydrogenase [Clostridia bacterium]|nr:homoserine dehydrogenase [Clostridia bacterium]
MVYVAIMGHGVVGGGVAEVLRKNAASIAKKAGQEIVIKRILDLREFPDSPYADRFTKNPDDIIHDPEIAIVIETMGGLHPAYEFVKACLENGKSVVTSNKELVAAKGDELLAFAKQHNLNFLFEASVGGGIPILRPINQCLTANEVYEIAGILNGTTNFMLTKMIEEDMSFDEALSLAQRLGYAERDPSADIDGHDTCRKVCILAALGFGKHVYPAQVHTEGIRGVSLTDVKYAAAAGYAIKLIGRARARDDGRIFCMVAPMLVPKDNLLSDVRDVFNAIMVRGDAIGDVMFYGRGAGALPTASAVVADVIDEVKHIARRKMIFWESGSDDYVCPYTEDQTAAMVRLTADLPETAKAAVTAAFGEVRWIALIGQPENELCFLTEVQNEQTLAQTLQGLSGVQIQSCIRLFGE